MKQFVSWSPPPYPILSRQGSFAFCCLCHWTLLAYRDTSMQTLPSAQEKLLSVSSAAPSLSVPLSSCWSCPWQWGSTAELISDLTVTWWGDGGLGLPQPTPHTILTLPGRLFLCLPPCLRDFLSQLLSRSHCLPSALTAQQLQNGKQQLSSRWPSHGPWTRWAIKVCAITCNRTKETVRVHHSWDFFLQDQLI